MESSTYRLPVYIELDKCASLALIPAVLVEVCGRNSAKGLSIIESVDRDGHCEVEVSPRKNDSSSAWAQEEFLLVA